MRTGPRPLSVQIGLAASARPPGEGYAPPGQQAPPEELEKMLLGIKLYQSHIYKPERLPLETLWQDGQARVLGIPGHDYAAHKPPVLPIPSLINRAYIMDLVPGRSLLRFLAAQGLNPCLLDWGESAQDEGQQDMDGVILRRMVPAIAFMAARAGRPVHAVGYCMGGTLLLGGAGAAKDHLASLVMLAAPWDFHGGRQDLLNVVKFWAPTAFPQIDEKGRLPMDWIQAVFAALDPFMAARKFAKFLDMDQQSDEARLFVAVEDWLNDGADLPAGVALSCIRDWFIGNRPGAGAWAVGGRPVIPEEIDLPALVIASQKDRLVEFETAAGLAGQIPGAELLRPDCGHIGMIAGAAAAEQVWAPLARWIAAQQ